MSRIRRCLLWFRLQWRVQRHIADARKARTLGHTQLAAQFTLAALKEIEKFRGTSSGVEGHARQT